MSKYLIYGLIDPRNQQLRYVGKSSVGLLRPQKFHSAKCRSWEMTLTNIGLTKEIEIFEELEEGPGIRDRLNDAETFWIGYFKMIGADLTNLTKGGDGFTAGYVMSVATREKLSKAHTGRKRDDQWKRAISEGVRGKNKGKKRTIKQRKRTSQLMKLAWKEGRAKGRWR